MLECFFARRGAAVHVAALSSHIAHRSRWPALCLWVGLIAIWALPVAAAEPISERRPASPAPSIEEDNRSDRNESSIASAGTELAGLPSRLRQDRSSAGAAAALRARRTSPVAARPRYPAPASKSSVVEQIRRAAFSAEKGR